MESIHPLPFAILAFQLMIGIILVGLIIYFAVKRVKAKKLEDFEKRDN